MKKFIVVILFGILYVTAFAENYKVTTDKLNIRACANKNCEIIGQLHQNEIVNLLEKTISEDGSEWGRITLSNGEEGFVTMSFIEPVTQEGELSSEKDNSSLESTFGPFLWIGVFSMIIFIILFRISKKKQAPIFMGVGDLIILIVALVTLSFVIQGTSMGEKFEIPYFILSLVLFFVSIFLTLRKPYALKDKIFSILSKLAFLLTGVCSVLLLLVWLVDASIRKEKGKSSLWQELKEISKNKQVEELSDEYEE